MTTDIVQVKFEIQVPSIKWLYRLNKKYSELSFNILSNYIINEKIGNTLFEIKGNSLAKFLKEFKNLIPPSSYRVLYQDDNLLLMNVKIEDPWIFNALVKTKLLLMYPLNIKEGKIHMSAVTERKKVDNFLEELEEKNIRFKIMKIGQYQHQKLLSDRQKKLLNTLYKEGYYEVPRAISLSELAKKKGISPSALSESIRRLHKRLAKIQLSELE